jgi:hypothetical protein
MQRALAIILLNAAFAFSANSQNVGSMQINSSESIHFIVTDPLGRRTGADPRGEVTDTVYGVSFIHEIPSANYSFSGVDKLEGGPAGPESHEFNFNPQSPQEDGLYRLQAIGVRLSQYLIDSYVLQDTGGGYRTWDFRVSGVIDKDSVITYRFSYYGGPGKDLTFVKSVGPSSLLQDVAAMRKLNWIANQPAADRYSELFRSYASQFKENNIKAAQSTLESVLASLKANQGITLTTDAYNSLSSDTKQLITELPTVTTMLDTLVAYKHRSFASGLLGDDNFEKELDNGLRNAQKHLAKRDSTNARKEIKTFQEKVDKEYEKTSSDRKKGKPRDRRYMTESGWKLLHFNAQFIIDRLPEEKKGKK